MKNLELGFHYLARKNITLGLDEILTLFKTRFLLPKLWKFLFIDLKNANFRERVGSFK